MSVHESSVNFQNLIRDLAEMYPHDITEVVVVELIANSLDAKASRISIDYNPKRKSLVVQDNGEGMNPSQFEEYHDFAAGLKTRGTGIGFAGLGAKVSFNIADSVRTETRSKSLSAGSKWYLESKKRLIWEEIEPENLDSCGTRVEVSFRLDTNPLYTQTQDLIELLNRHYLPLLDPNFLDLYDRMNLYTKQLRFVVNGQVVKPTEIIGSLSLDSVREFFPERRKKRFGYGILGVAASEYPVAPDVCGVLLCTHGKVIKADMFNQFPASFGPRLFGIVEIPEFVNFLTTSKTDFMRKGRHKEFERLYDPVRQTFMDWLRSIGVESSEIVDRDEVDALQKELRKIMEEVPELGDFFGVRVKKSVLDRDDSGSIHATTQEDSEVTFPVGNGVKGGGLGPLDTGDETGEAAVKDDEGEERASPISRKSRRGPRVTFVDALDRVDLGWVDGSNVVINSGHPCYAKNRPNPKTRRLHCLFAIASAVQRFLGSESETPDLMFIDRMMKAWGEK